jgi:hypothetical protein
VVIRLALTLPHLASVNRFRTNAVTASWAAAEEALNEADRWLFVGYSLPDGDYEFAHLLQTAELKRANLGVKKIEAVVYEDPNAEEKFKNTFGRNKVTVHQGGLESYVSGGLSEFVS